MEQIFKINFKNHGHKLSAVKVGNCIVSGQFFIGEIEIEDITETHFIVEIDNSESEPAGNDRKV